MLRKFVGFCMLVAGIGILVAGLAGGANIAVAGIGALASLLGLAFTLWPKKR